LLVALVVGLAFSISVSQIALAAPAAWLLRGAALLRRLPPEAGGDRALVLGSLAAIVTFLVGGLFEYNFGDTEVLLVALALMALPFALVPERPPAGA
jgi:hypothetical protein